MGKGQKGPNVCFVFFTTYTSRTSQSLRKRNFFFNSQIMTRFAVGGTGYCLELLEDTEVS